MDVLRYNAGASSANPALPRSLLARSRLCKLGMLHNASRSSLASSWPRGQRRSPSVVSAGWRAKARTTRVKCHLAAQSLVHSDSPHAHANINGPAYSRDLRIVA
eukprot:scaffold142663_cov69-Attheya_sp.AAC.2